MLPRGLQKINGTNSDGASDAEGLKTGKNLEGKKQPFKLLIPKSKNLLERLFSVILL